MINLNDFFLLLFPDYCAGCTRLLVKGESAICFSCQASLPRLNQHDYRDNKLERKFWGRTDVLMATAFLKMSKKNIVRKIIHDLKYHDNKSVGVALGKLLGIELSKSNDMNQFDFIIPVPLHPKKLFQRGYNQCDCIAEGLSESMNIPVCNNQLIRAQFNKSQTRKSRYKRWENVEGIFAVKDQQYLANKSVLLVDDIITTGSTIEACATELNKIDGLKLSVAAIAISET